MKRFGRRNYELGNHLSNVLSVITDNIGMTEGDSTWAHVVSTSDYYPFGLEMRERSWTDTTSLTWRYGFNGKERDKNGEWGNTGYDYGFRVYDPALARFKSVDPFTKLYSKLTPYQFSSNRPIDGIDLDGMEYVTVHITVDEITGAILSTKSIWKNPDQHSEYGSRGKGVEYRISVWNSWFKQYKSYDQEKFVRRNAAVLLGTFATEYGNYYGATGLYEVNSNGSFANGSDGSEKRYDYSVDPVDAVDNFARIHDQSYDAVKASGENGLFDDWGTTPADEAAIEGWQSILDLPKGARDPFNGQSVTSAERNASDFFLLKRLVSSKVTLNPNTTFPNNIMVS